MTWRLRWWAWAAIIALTPVAVVVWGLVVVACDQ